MSGRNPALASASKTRHRRGRGVVTRAAAIPAHSGGTGCRRNKTLAPARRAGQPLYGPGALAMSTMLVRCLHLHDTRTFADGTRRKGGHDPKRISPRTPAEGALDFHLRHFREHLVGHQSVLSILPPRFQPGGTGSRCPQCRRLADRARVPLPSGGTCPLKSACRPASPVPSIFSSTSRATGSPPRIRRRSLGLLSAN